MPAPRRASWGVIYGVCCKYPEKTYGLGALRLQVTFSFLLRGLRPRVLVEHQQFRFPLPVAARIALLEANFRTEWNIQAFTIEDLPWLRAWAPKAVVLPLNLALSLADQKRRGLFDLPSLDTAIVVLTSIDDEPLAGHHRDLLWSAFGVPVFEQLRAPDGTVVARECEVHDGLHFEPDELPSLPGEVVTDMCACGSEKPRLRGAAPVGVKSAIAAAGRAFFRS
jgi:hypothetical protein